jgi:hypothetical protein
MGDRETGTKPAAAKQNINLFISCHFRSRFENFRSDRFSGLGENTDSCRGGVPVDAFARLVGFGGVCPTFSNTEDLEAFFQQSSKFCG